MDKPSIHDIRLRFSVKGLWSILSSCCNDIISNKDITLNDIDLKDHVIKTTVHRTNTVNVIIDCSNNPISIDIIGLAKLTSRLARVEDRLQRLLADYYNSFVSNRDGNDGDSDEDNICNKKNKKVISSIPAKYMITPRMSWTVIM